MKFLIIRNLLEKEILALSRNKRILLGLILPVLLVPILFHGYNQIKDITARGSEEAISRIYLIGNVPDQVMELIDEDVRFERIVHIDNYEKEIKDKNLDLVLIYNYTEDSHKFQLKYDSGRNAGRRASERIEGYLLDFKASEQLRLLTLAKEDQSVLNPVSLEVQDIAKEEEVLKHTLSNILPLLLTLYALLSIVNFAIELTTAEKELGTLETLFSTPIRKEELVVAKLMACVLFGILSMILSLLVLLILMPRIIDMGTLHVVAEPATIIVLAVTLLPLIVMGAGVSIGVGMFANSYKESGAYITPLVFLFMIPAYIGATPGLELNAFYAILPILNATLLIKSVFIGGISINLLAITLVMNSLFSVLSLTFMFKVFGTERLLFGIGKGTSFKLRRKELKERDLIEVEDIFMSLAIIVILYIYMSTLLTNSFGIVKSTLFIQYTAFAVLPVGIIWYLKASQKKSLGLKRPPIGKVFGGIFLWIAAFSLALIYQILIAPFIPQVPSLIELEAQLHTLSPLTKFFFIAVTPGICEEILFRGFAFRPLEKNFGSKWAIMITSIIFAVVHLDFVRLLPTFLLGLVFGYTAHKTKSLYPSIFLHILNNGFAAFAPVEISVNILNLSVICILSSIIGHKMLEKKGKYRAKFFQRL